MLPDVRLMITAVFAAALMLICGFGMFATFRVSHAPLERVASASPLHLFTAQDAAPLMVTAAAPFNNRFETVGPGSRSVAALAYAAPEPAERPEMKVIAPAADHSEQNAAQPAPEPTTSPAPEGADVPTQQAESSEAAPEPKPDETPAAVTPSVAPNDPTIVALVEPPIAGPEPGPAQPPVHIEEVDVSFAPPTVEPVRTLPDLTTNTAEKTEKKVKHARTHRLHKPPATAEAFAFGTQVTFQTGLGWWTPQEPQKAPAKIPRSKIIANIPADETPGTGGPFVSAPRH